MWLFVLFLVVPLIEIALFIQIGGIIGLWSTLAIVVLTAVLGTIMIRAQGALAMEEVRKSFSDLRDPTEPLAHGAMILFSGALLLTPGFFTDFVGFSLLLLPVRKAVFAYFRSRVNVKSFTAGQSRTQEVDPARPVIDGDYKDITPDSGSKPGKSGWTKH